MFCWYFSPTLLYSLSIYYWSIENHLSEFKKLKLIYLWASIAFIIWLVLHDNNSKYICEVTGNTGLVFPAKPLLYSLFNMFFVNEKSFFRSYKDLPLIYLWTVVLKTLLILIYNQQKSMYRVTGDVWLVFPAKPLLYSLSIWFCLRSHNLQGQNCG